MRKLITIAFILCSAAMFYGSIYGKRTEDVPSNYIMLFTFGNSFLSEENIASKETIKAINESPYDGVAATVIQKTYEAPDMENNPVFRAAVNSLKKYCRKDIWVVCPLACIVGKNVKHCHNSARKLNPEMENIKGMDLDNETGRLEKFYRAWRGCLKLARELNSPGLIFDHEFYTNYEMAHLEKLANARDEDIETVVHKLESIGAEMAGIVSETYPECKILVLETMLYKPSDKYCFTPGHIILGLLKEAAENNIPLEVIDGGEGSMGYLHASIKSLQDKIARRRRIYASYMKKYPNLKLAGCIAPFLDKENRPYWMTRANSAQFPYSSAEEFVPMIKELLENYRFVWVYAGWKTYMPFFPPGWNEEKRKPFLSHAKRMNAVIREAEKEAKYIAPAVSAYEGASIPRFKSLAGAIGKGAKLYFGMSGRIPRNNFFLKDSASGPRTEKLIVRKLKKNPPTYFSLKVEYPEWKKGNYEWPGFTVIPSIRDLSGVSALFMEIGNDSDSPVALIINIRDEDKREYPKRVLLDKKEKRLVIVRVDEVSSYIDINRLNAISFVLTRPENDFTVKYSDIFYLPKDRAGK